MLENVSVYELANSALEFFPLEELLKTFDEEDYAMFFMNDELEKEVVMEQIRSLPEDIMQIFIESVTGQPQEDVDANELMTNIEVSIDYPEYDTPEVENSDISEKINQLSDSCLEIYLRYAFMKPSSAPSMTALMFPVSYPVRLSLTSV